MVSNRATQHIELLRHIMLYRRRKEISPLDLKAFLDTHVCIKNPYRQKSGIITFLCKYYIVISNIQMGSWMCFSCCLLYYYQSFMRNQKERIKLQEKEHRRISVWDINFFLLHTLVSMSFLSILSSTPFPYPSDVLFE